MFSHQVALIFGMFQIAKKSFSENQRNLKSFH